ncbi:class I SAM-dependent methyltransferase [Tichowtungia aerotolerans]|uniref:Methyltransferase domain-containing protein n=1 Tax=Tichowtungia aerotolerans TaxID=2697043 RepID=A0A6P1MI69_9BACT|nr:class I SAM-dependent methyltransferase [Tichowtungia aerotolerans]QHI70745.1 methyltransferase domain-containing protein [Tichowtungia aerotolerans]
MTKKKQLPDLHYFYEASVQGVDWDVDFAARVFKNKRNRKPLDLREDFCGTAALACEWVGHSSKRRAWGVDIDQPTLDWSMEHNIPYLDKKAGKIELVCGDVMTAKTPPVDLVMALNFSYCIFKTRDLLRAYFEKVRKNLKKDGIFVIDLYGGTEAIEAKLEPRDVDGFTAADGTKVPPFEYIWDQDVYNVIDHHVVNYIHFKVPGFGKIEKAFTYDWRLWTLPEIQELLIEAGFKSAEVYLHGWNDEGESDDTYKKRTYYENSLGWVAYIVGIK